MKSINLSLLCTRSPLPYHQSHHHRFALQLPHFKIYSSSAFYIHSCFIVATSCSFSAFLSTISKNYLNEHCHLHPRYSINLVKQKRQTHLILSFVSPPPSSTISSHLNILKFLQHRPPTNRKFILPCINFIEKMR